MLGLYSTEDKLLALLYSVPVCLSLISFGMRIFGKQNERTQGYVFNGYKYISILLPIDIVSCLAVLIGQKLLAIRIMDSQIFSNVVLVSVLYFISYYLMAYKPVTQEQLAQAKEEGKTCIEYTEDTSAGIISLIFTALSMAFSLILSALNPKNIIATIGNKVYYTKRDNDDLAIGLVFSIVIIVFVVLILFIVANFTSLLIPAIMYLAIVVTFCYNLYKYRNGPVEQ